jgi:hypothetical protein
MTGNQALAHWRQIAFHNVQIRSAYATRAHSQEHVTWLDCRFGNISDEQRTARDILGLFENGCFHGFFTDGICQAKDFYIKYASRRESGISSGGSLFAHIKEKIL